MSDDYRVPPRADRELREDAAQARDSYGATNRRPVNIIRHLQSGWIPTKKGRQKLIYKVVGDSEMGDKDGRTDFSAEAVIITVKRSVHDKRSRMTLAHELAHGVLHHGVPMYRGSDATGTTLLSKTNAAESAEHHAKVFASAFLIEEAVAVTLATPVEISLEFGVSLEAAKICFERLAEEAECARAAERVKRSNDDYQNQMRGRQTPTFSYLDEPCST
jgi:Zn-dependent peptidase ImmA (M78 family)